MAMDTSRSRVRIDKKGGKNEKKNREDNLHRLQIWENNSPFMAVAIARAIVF